MLQSLLAALLITLSALQAGATPSFLPADARHVSYPFDAAGESFLKEPFEIKQKAACIAEQPSHGLPHCVTSLLHFLQPYLGQERVERYTSHVQVAMNTKDGETRCDEKFQEDVKLIVEEDATDSSVAGSDEATRDWSIGQSEPVDLEQVPKGLILALGVLVSVLGVAVLLACLKRRCCSLRRKVERLADREERIKAREYRIAAKQESRRRFWLRVRRGFTSCFTGGSATSDEEKATLVLNAAEHGQSGESLEEAQAHMRGLCYAHDIAAQLAATGHFGDIGLDSTGQSQAQTLLQCRMQGIFDRVVPRYSRSRASSLPSYDSDMLPDYSSQPDMDQVLRSAMIVDGFRRPLLRTNSGGSSRFTPESSIPDISTGPSFETLSTQENVV